MPLDIGNPYYSRDRAEALGLKWPEPHFLTTPEVQRRFFALMQAEYGIPLSYWEWEEHEDDDKLVGLSD